MKRNSMMGAGLFLVGMFFFGAALLAACGGGGGSGGGGYGNTLPPSSGPGDAENFFPVATGDTWNYYVTTTGPVGNAPPVFLDKLTVTGTRTVLGAAATVFVEANPAGMGLPSEGYYNKTPGGLAFLGTNDWTDTVTPSLVPYEVALFPMAAGTIAQFSKSGLDFGRDLDGDGLNEKVDVTVTTAIAGFEPLTIGLGTFPRTAKATETLSGNVILSKTQTAIPFTTTATRWAAPGIGLLRRPRNTMVQSTASGDNFEARGYVVDGTQHGFGDVLNVSTTTAQLATPAIASNGTSLLWATETPAGLVARVISGSGTDLGGATLDGSVGPAYPVAGFDGTNYWVAFNGTTGFAPQVLAHRLSTTGALQEAQALVLVNIAGTQLSSIGFTALAFGPGSGLLAYTGFNGTTYQHELWGVVVQPDGTVGAPFAIATDNSTHLYPAVAFDGTNFLVAWQQLASSGATAGSILARRIAPSGAAVDATPLLIAAAPNGQFQPSVAFDGTNYLVVWLDLRNNVAGEIYGARVAPGATLALVDGPAASGGFAIATGGTASRTAPRVEFNGTEYLVAWTSPGGYTVAQGVQAVRVSPAGVPAVPSTIAIPVSGAPLAITNAQYGPPVLARRGNTIGVFWRIQQSPPPGLASPLPSLQASVFAPF